MIMPLEPDGYEAHIKVDHTLTDALNAQLTLLDGFFPLQGWLVVRRHGGEFTVLAAQGDWIQDQSLNSLDDLLRGPWVAFAEHPGFHHRLLDDDEKARLASLLASSCRVPGYLIRRPLRNPDGYVQAWLLGVADEQAIAKISEPDFSFDYIKQGVLGMGLCITLHAELVQVQRQLAELQENAFTEPLTRVLNRAGWINRVQHLEAIVARSNEDVAIIMLDLDLLKLVNDLEGHSAGDELLQLTAQTIQSVVRSSDVVGRLGGDEFGVAVRGVDLPLAEALTERLRMALDKVGVEVSVGMALKSEADNLDKTLILADMRMYAEKHAKPVPDRAMNWKRDAVRKNLDSHT